MRVIRCRLTMTALVQPSYPDAPWSVFLRFKGVFIETHVFCLFVAFLGTNISWGTWQRTQVQTTWSFSSFQVRGSSVSRLDKHSLILLALCDKNVDGFSLSRFFCCHYLFIVRICITFPQKSHLLCMSNLLSTLVCHVQRNLKQDHSFVRDDEVRGADKHCAVYLGPFKKVQTFEILSYAAKTNPHLKGKKVLTLAVEETASLVFVRVTKNIFGLLF